MAVFGYYTKGLLSNRNLWFWGVAFMLFWLLLGAYSFSSGVPRNILALKAYTATWFGTIALFSLSSLAISIAYSIYYSSYSLIYCFRHSRLTPASYVLNLIASSSVLGILLTIIMLLTTYVLFSVRFGFNIVPYSPLDVIAVSALGGVFMMAFSITLILVVVNYAGMKSMSLVEFVPLVLAFGLGLGQINSSLPEAVLYLSPYNAIQSLLFQAYSGIAPPAEFSIHASPTLQWPLLILSLLTWIAVLLFLDLRMLGRLRPRQLEEGRQI